MTSADKLTALFSDFAKWETYAAAFNMVDAGECRIIDVQDAAHAIGIAPSVVAMRRHDFRKMTPA
tara:strand:- start:339 stop:533 length:195 start_codon:yes stop_codon:yes gene_type:complete